MCARYMVAVVIEDKRNGAMNLELSLRRQCCGVVESSGCGCGRVVVVVVAVRREWWWRWVTSSVWPRDACLPMRAHELQYI
jgi:hypothetical protein